MAKTPARASSAKTKKGMGQFVAAKTAPKPKPEPPAALIAAVPERRSKRIFDERKPLMTRLTPAQHRRLRQLALELNTTVQDLVVEALSTYLVEKRGLDPL